MGFFSDLKEDLSQAVNELLPEDELVKKTDASKETMSLDEMLQNIDDIQVPQEELQEPGAVVEADPVAEAFADQEELPLAVQEVLAEKVPRTEPARQEPVKAQADQEIHKKIDSYIGRQTADEISVIMAGMTVTGDVSTEGSLDVLGTVNGKVEVMGKLNITGHINGDSKAAEIYAESAKIKGEVVCDGAVKVGASAVIIGNITATSAAIAGAIKGDIDVRGPVILDSSAIVMGNIRSKSVQINNGAVIEGMCSQCYAEVSPTTFFGEIDTPAHAD